MLEDCKNLESVQPKPFRAVRQDDHCPALPGARRRPPQIAEIVDGEASWRAPLMAPNLFPFSALRPRTNRDRNFGFSSTPNFESRLFITVTKARARVPKYRTPPICLVLRVYALPRLQYWPKTNSRSLYGATTCFGRESLISKSKR
jgi:hypothetical protein